MHPIPPIHIHIHTSTPPQLNSDLPSAQSLPEATDKRKTNNGSGAVDEAEGAEVMKLLFM